MKKTLVIILSIVLCIALAGAAVAVGGEGKIFNKEDVVSDPDLQTADTEEKEEEKAVEPTNSSKIEETIEAEILSAEDLNVKQKINKYTTTNIDFRNSKKQVFGGKEYDLEFIDMGSNLSAGSLVDTLSKRITYHDSEDNRFIYDIKTGELRTVSIKSNALNKTANSISEEKAKELVNDFMNDNYGSDKYILDSFSCNEQVGYSATYSKHICGYPTSDSIGFIVDFDGKIRFMNIATGMFDEFKIETINEDILLKNLKSLAGENLNYTVDSKRLIVEDDVVKMEYYIIIDSGSYTSGRVYTIPIE